MSPKCRRFSGPFPSPASGSMVSQEGRAPADLGSGRWPLGPSTGLSFGGWSKTMATKLCSYCA